MRQYDLQIDIDEAYVEIMGRFSRAERAILRRNPTHGLLCSTLGKDEGPADQQPPLVLADDGQGISYNAEAVRALTDEALTVALDALLSESISAKKVDMELVALFASSDALVP